MFFMGCDLLLAGIGDKLYSCQQPSDADGIGGAGFEFVR